MCKGQLKASVLQYACSTRHVLRAEFMFIIYLYLCPAVMFTVKVALFTLIVSGVTAQSAPKVDV
jgi:hypothetical protein